VGARSALKEAGLVSDQAHGTRRVYRVDPSGVAAMRAYFDAFWNQALGSFKAPVEGPDDKESR
jgi:hypothetical protein